MEKKTMFKLKQYPKHLNPNDHRDETLGKERMLEDIQDFWERGFNVHGFTSDEHHWEVLYGPDRGVWSVQRS